MDLQKKNSLRLLLNLRGRVPHVFDSKIRIFQSRTKDSLGKVGAKVKVEFWATSVERLSGRGKGGVQSRILCRRERGRERETKSIGIVAHGNTIRGWVGVWKERTTIHGSFAAHNANTRVPRDCTRFWKSRFGSIVRLSGGCTRYNSTCEQMGERKVAVRLRRPLGRRII